jgi:hypothetical protein
LFINSCGSETDVNWAGILGHLWGHFTTPHFRDVWSLLAAFKWFNQ